MIDELIGQQFAQTFHFVGQSATELMRSTPGAPFTASHTT